ncbi:hypothetical protein [Clostridium folliculivorans]|uniref:Uncharacterized protein n=1 Tax=Clostridium folliculivorans TaxID=2886038 RepID=A0A9W5Y2N5_9CLOT|nr:hypothetical protein [Clostridium folliculivorans]GKU25465.1 hypothetical protein CFOLD11_22910 [Clostridium folliculivorans]GKU28487.1 hypothetical protein CFB3_05930 [Clostridium folliculivorans]
MNKIKFKSLTTVFIIAISLIVYAFFLNHIETRQDNTTIIKSGKYYFKRDFVGESGIKHPVYDISVSEKEAKKNIQENKTNKESLFYFYKNIFLIKSMKITSIFTGFIFIIITVFMFEVIYDKQLNLSKVEKKKLLPFVVCFLIICTLLSVYKINQFKKLESNLVVYYNSI